MMIPISLLDKLRWIIVELCLRALEKIITPISEKQFLDKSTYVK